MVTLHVDYGQVDIPDWVVDIESFRRWTDTTEFPQNTRVWWLKREVWIDVSKEQVFTHLGVKNEFYYVLTGLVKAGQLGLFLPDGLLLSNFAAEISGNPDATFLSNDTLRSDRVRLIEGVEGGYVEVQGTLDMVLEVVSRSSEEKDLVVLRQAYWEADIPEYWLVDARKDPLRFDILRYSRRGYVATRKTQGWVKSAVFGKSFRLTKKTNDLGHPEYTLAVK